MAVNLLKLHRWVSLASSISRSSLLATAQPRSVPCILERSIATTATKFDLMEFFEDPKHWGEKTVKVGRSWKVDELRLKSNSDLHKLWYILLKERNMLLTMEHDAKDEFLLFPNPERIDKVEDSMENLETVVRERNRAYFELETGTSGERSGEEFENWIGLPEYRQYEEHPVPKEENKQWHQKMEEEKVESSSKEKADYMRDLRAAQRRVARKRKKSLMCEVHTIFQLYPHVDVDAVKDKFPDLEPEVIDKIQARHKDIIYENNVVPQSEYVWGKRTVNGSYKKMTWANKYRLN